ncbi:hypothetical protein [Streptomyces sp. NPDC046939]|uniref:hypothetical protein n=1 Tax=Streptomyces sp. NPDC046939 TaxID=3155376 RepID=UPI003403652E
MTRRGTSATASTPRLLAALVLLTALLAGTAAPGAMAADPPTVTLSRTEAGAGGSITVRGTGWGPRTLLMMLVCGQASPARGVIGGTNSCANGDGRAVTTDRRGTFSRRLPVVEPPRPCPCVVHVATVKGGPKAQVDAVLKVAGHPVRALPAEPGAGQLSMVTDTRLEGSSGLLTWFGAPPARKFVFTVGNVGPSPVRNPVFQVGTAHGVFAPQYEEQQWRGTVAPGRKARISLPVELPGGAHGDYLVSLKYGGKVLAEQPWGVGRPWGVVLFWVLLCVVVPAAVFRIGMAVVDRLRPRDVRAAGRHRDVQHLTDLTKRPADTAKEPPRPRAPRDGAAASPTTTLPWFAPDTGPGGSAAGQLSAPPDNSRTTKGNT